MVVYSEGVGAGQEIMGRLVRADGTVFPPFNISIHPGQPDSQPAVAYKMTTKEYLVVWRYGVAPGTNHIFARRIRNDEIPLGGSFPIAMTAFDEAEPDVAADPLSTGRYLVVWWEVGSASNRGQLLLSDGTLDGPSFELFKPTRTGPRVAYGSSSPANYFLTATTDVNANESPFFLRRTHVRFRCHCRDTKGAKKQRENTTTLATLAPER